ncbi:MAG: hypothetical protein A4E50_01360 [Methanosaeta sp. PtaB.Bin087]|jgi:hypothetical protein|nr:MAG: hypothetical protein A4E50_01360 [Methanosaeta sp. PtaB.Bin087]
MIFCKAGQMVMILTEEKFPFFSKFGNLDLAKALGGDYDDT